MSHAIFVLWKPHPSSHGSEIRNGKGAHNERRGKRKIIR
jgi:hypothetical protein